MNPQAHAHPNVAVNFCPVCGTNINAILMTLVFNMMRQNGQTPPKAEAESSALPESQSNGAPAPKQLAAPAAPKQKQHKRAFFSVPDELKERILAEASQHPSKSHRAIGAQHGVSDTTVGRILAAAKKPQPKQRPKPASEAQKAAVLKLREADPNLPRREIAERTLLTVKQVDAIIYPSNARKNPAQPQHEPATASDNG